MFGKARECLREVMIEGDEEIVVKCENLGFFVYREITDLSSPGYFNYDCPQSCKNRVFRCTSVDKQMNSRC